jgi:ELWxxDGT repeat protein
LIKDKPLIKHFLIVLLIQIIGIPDVFGTTKVIRWVYPTSYSEIAKNCQILLQFKKDVNMTNYGFVLVNQEQDSTGLRFKKAYCHPNGSIYVFEPKSLLNIGDTVSLSIDPEKTIDTNRYPFPAYHLKREGYYQKKWFVTQDKDTSAPEWGSYFNYQLKNFRKIDRNLSDIGETESPKVIFDMAIKDPEAWSSAKSHRGDTSMQYLMKVTINGNDFLIPTINRITLERLLSCHDSNFLKIGRTYQIQFTVMDYSGNISQTSKTVEITFEHEFPGSPDKNPRMVKNINPDGACKSKSLKKSLQRIPTKLGVPVRNSNPGDFKILGDNLYFYANHYQYGREPWVSDGTREGTQLFKDMNNGTDYSGYYHSTIHNGNIYWITSPLGKSEKLWASDGRIGKTTIIFPKKGQEGHPHHFKEKGNELYFTVYRNWALNYWITDGTKSGTKKALDLPERNAEVKSKIRLKTADLLLREHYNYDSDSFTYKIWFNRLDSPHSVLLKSFKLENRTNFEPEFIFKDRPYFNFEDSGAFPFYTINERKTGIEKAEGVLQGLEYLRGKIYNWQCRLFFGGGKTKYACEPMVADSLRSRPRRLKDINQTDEVNGQSYPRNFQACNGKLFFTAKLGRHNRRLWVTDGTTDGTQLLQVDLPSDHNSVEEVVCLNNRLYFITETELFGRELTERFGRELWVSDGTKRGTHIICDISIPADGNGGNGVIGNLKVFDDELYFQGFREGYGIELWKYNPNEPINLH